MPQKTQRTLDTEVQLAETIAQLRRERGWTYEELADRMEAVGCKIHASGIQKTEKSGRRITVDELIGYSRALEVPVDSLVDSTKPMASTLEFWRDYLSAERFYVLKERSLEFYEEVVESVQKEAAVNSELRAAIKDRLEAHVAMQTKRAREMAAQDGDDVSTDEKFQAYLWGSFSTVAMKTARDVLEGVRDGES